jgi:hypothetical protein
METRLVEIKLYSLSELSADNIDAWVEAISTLADRYGDEVDGYDPDEDCPADFECAFNALVERHGVLFTEDGEIYEEGRHYVDGQKAR